MAMEFPASFVFDRGTAVLADFVRVEHVMSLDPSSGVLRGRSHITFELPLAGHAVFDLVPQPHAARIDGAPVHVLERPFGEGPSSCRIIDRALEAGPHVLELEHEVAGAYRGGRFVTSMDDRRERCFLERWLPTSFEHDVYEMRLDLSVAGAAPHRLWSNAFCTRVDTLPNRWSLCFPPSFSCSSFFVLVAVFDAYEEHLDSLTVGTASLPLILVAPRGVSVAATKSELDRSLERLVPVFGALPPIPRFLVQQIDVDGMEYTGAAAVGPGTGHHELCHQYVGRGVRPRSGRSAWFDEGVAEWIADDCPRGSAVLSRWVPVAGTTWQRSFARSGYSRALALIERLAHHLGVDALTAALRAILNGRATHYDNATLRATFEAAATDDEQRDDVRSLFSDHVTGYPTPPHEQETPMKDPKKSKAKRDPKGPAGPDSASPARRPISRVVASVKPADTHAFRANPEDFMTRAGLLDGEQRVMMAVDPHTIAAFARLEEGLSDADHAQLVADVTKMRGAADATKTVAGGWPGPGITMQRFQPTRSTAVVVPLLTIEGNGLMDCSIVRFVREHDGKRTVREWTARLKGSTDYMRRTLEVRPLDLRGLPPGDYDIEVTNALGLPAARNSAFTVE